MDYFFFNTNKDVIVDRPRPRYGVLINHDFAATGGSRERFGEQLRQLSTDDILFMYENGIGIVAVGEVLEEWDGLSHDNPLYYTPREVANFTTGHHEYRIAVNWFMDLTNAPIDIDEVRERFGIPRGTVRRIVEKRAEAEALVEELERMYGN